MTTTSRTNVNKKRFTKNLKRRLSLSNVFLLPLLLWFSIFVYYMAFKFDEPNRANLKEALQVEHQGPKNMGKSMKNVNVKETLQVELSSLEPDAEVKKKLDELNKLGIQVTKEIEAKTEQMKEIELRREALMNQSSFGKNLNSLQQIRQKFMSRKANQCHHFTSFPPGCSLKCYLQHNEDVKRVLGHSDKLVLRHYLNDGCKTIRRCDCHEASKILLLAGPHKAASTTLQTIAKTYGDSGKNGWKYVDPSDIDGGIKSFANLVFSYFNMTYLKKGGVPTEPNFPLSKSSFEQEIKNLYPTNNLVLGSEEIDQIARTGGDKFIDEFKNMLPKEVFENDLLSILILYRSPRIKHLYSMFNEARDSPDVVSMTFRDFVISDHIGLNFHTIDTLKVADVLVKKGLKLKVLDMNGFLHQSNQPFSSFLGCEIMEMPCAEISWDNKKIRLPESFIIEPDFAYLFQDLNAAKNVRSFDLWNMTLSERSEIDELMKHYDCGFAHLFGHDQVEILYGDELIKNMKECESFESAPPSLSDLIVAMRKVLGVSVSGPANYAY